jgi:hypothetical protein
MGRIVLAGLSRILHSSALCPGCGACTCGTAPPCASNCTGVGIYPGNWTPCPTTPSPTPLPSPTPMLTIPTTTPSPNQSTAPSTTSSSGGFNLIVVTTSMEYSRAVSASLWVQNSGTVVTLSGQALSGVAITSQSVSLSGDLVLDVSAFDVYDGMTFTLINATSITGQWATASVYSTSECVEYQVDVTYTQQFAVGTLTTVSLCFTSIESIVLGIALL